VLHQSCEFAALQQSSDNTVDGIGAELEHLECATLGEPRGLDNHSAGGDEKTRRDGDQRRRVD
jgi:hypothetical protein